MAPPGALYPPPKIPRVLDPVAEPSHRVSVKSPKSVTLPVDPIVTYSRRFVPTSLFPGIHPPPVTPRVGLDVAASISLLPALKFPKSEAFPVEAIVI